MFQGTSLATPTLAAAVVLRGRGGEAAAAARPRAAAPGRDGEAAAGAAVAFLPDRDGTAAAARGGRDSKESAAGRWRRTSRTWTPRRS